VALVTVGVLAVAALLGILLGTLIP
jgi:hypothetical protein